MASGLNAHGALHRFDVGARARTRSTRPWPPKASAPWPPACPRITGTRPAPTAANRPCTGAYLAAVAFASAGSGLHHKICHVLGGTFNLPHAQTHATVLPYVLAFNAPPAPDAAARIAGGVRQPADAAVPG